MTCSTTTIQLNAADTDVMGYLVDMHAQGAVQLDESTSSTWIQAMPLGIYEHPVHGKIDISLERVKRFAQGVKEKWRGQDLDIDYDHKAKIDEAAGWVKDAEARDDGLWLLVEWTAQAFEKVKSKAYRYFSPEFVDAWEHPKTKQKYSDVLLGGALTNRPFLKDILPINLSEVTQDNVQSHSEGGSMTPEQIKQLAKLLGLPEDASAEQVMGGLLLKLNPEPGNDGKDPLDDSGDDKGNQGGGQASGGQGPQQVAASELPPELIKLSETNPELATFLSEQQKTIATQAAAIKLAETNAKVTSLDEFAASKKRALPPAVKDQLKTLLNSSSTQLSDGVLQLVTKLSEVGFVELGEKGAQTSTDNNESAVKKFNDAVDSLIKSSNLTYADAVERVASEQPKLFEDYRTESFAFRE